MHTSTFPRKAEELKRGARKEGEAIPETALLETGVLVRADER